MNFQKNSFLIDSTQDELNGDVLPASVYVKKRENIQHYIWSTVMPSEIFNEKFALLANTFKTYRLDYHEFLISTTNPKLNGFYLSSWKSIVYALHSDSQSEKKTPIKIEGLIM